MLLQISNVACDMLLISGKWWVKWCINVVLFPPIVFVFWIWLVHISLNKTAPTLANQHSRHWQATRRQDTNALMMTYDWKLILILVEIKTYFSILPTVSRLAGNIKPFVCCKMKNINVKWIQKKMIFINNCLTKIMSEQHAY